MKRTLPQNLLHPTPFKIGAIYIVCCCLLWLAWSDNKPRLLQSLDNHLFDAMFTIRGPVDSTGQVVIIDIDEQSLQHYGQWPWPRNLLANLSDKIFAAQPRAVGFHVVFSEKDRTSPVEILKNYPDIFPRHNTFPYNDKGLSELLLDYDTLFSKSLEPSKTVLGYPFLFRQDFLKKPDTLPKQDLSFHFIGKTVPVENLNLLTAYRAVVNIPNISENHPEGFFNLFPAPDNIVRKSPLLVLMDDKIYPSLAFEVFRIAQTEKKIQLKIQEKNRGEKYYHLQKVSIGDSSFKTDQNGQVAINYLGPRNTFFYLSALDVLQGTEANFLKDKYLLVGSSASGVMDTVSTPFSTRLPGIEVQATLLDNLLTQGFMFHDTDRESVTTLCLLVFGGILITTTLAYVGPLTGIGVTIGILGLTLFYNYEVLFLNNLLIGLSYPLLSLICIFITISLGIYLFEGRKRMFIKRAFSHYVSPTIVNDLLKNPKKLDLLVDTREVTVLFCDIRNFTTYAESTPVTELSRFLNEYFSLMTEIIIKHNGMVDKYIGDAIMAVWGTPISNPDHAAQGVNAALEMAQMVEQCGDRLQIGGKRIEIGIGLNSGKVSAGNFGSSNRFDYTVLGDNVNLASRVEGLTKYYPAPILVTDSTVSKVAGSCRCRYIDSVLVKGRNSPVDLFEPLDAENSKSFTLENEEMYMEAIALFKERNFEKAATLFNKLTQEQDDPVYLLYRKRCKTFQEFPPDNDWNGISMYN